MQIILSAVLLFAVSLAAGNRIVAQTDARRFASPRLTQVSRAKPRNVVLILTDDHRYDAMSFMGHPFLETPNLDALARNGAHFQNAFVTTSLCSPSRASILTGLYAHRHRVIDNNNRVPPGTIFFSQYLKQAGYETAFVGKWHMGGESDDPQPGFDHWVSFKGQGTYLPNPDGLNINGKRVLQKGYITDELTGYAVDWLKGRKGDKPFLLYLSHKAVHIDLVPKPSGQGRALLPGDEGGMEFIAAERHKGRYRDKTFIAPKTMSRDPQFHQGRPMWALNQRNSRLGADFPFYSTVELSEYHRQYAEALLAVDDSVGRVVETLRQMNQLDSTLVIYLGDNGYAFGEHGLVDKRTAYEESMRVPMIAHCPEMFRAGTKVTEMVANIDVAPAILKAAGLKAPSNLDGRSFIELAQGRKIPWREHLLYEYYWERNYPMTPTMHALRTSRYKYIRYYGVWDVDELYDLQADPLETKNLIHSGEHQSLVKDFNRRLFQTLDETGGMSIPMFEDRGKQVNQRRGDGAKAADFPPDLKRNPPPRN